ncbi:MAG: hypothetical protein L6437_02955 [Kiritimatiellae bacterium]|nr:hypothetical protein [Kiritimatiellia bacterium]MCG2812745.1 hypothetical protein [Candidatus Aminicenantes bacterium]
MINIISHVSWCIPRVVRRLALDLSQSLKPRIFQTETGVKYRFSGFDSDRFSEYVIHEIPFVSAGISFSDLLAPPDLLRDRYTTCGQSVLRSPYYQLINEIFSGTLKPNSEYLTRCRKGTLDARLPSDPSLEFLMQKFQMQQAALLSGKVITIFVVKATLRGNSAYVIADGKHRAALVAAYNRPESLLMRVISTDFVRDSFFSKVYSYTLRMDPAEYSINQGMIKVLQNEHQITKDCF